jgi:hypothetical protein
LGRFGHAKDTACFQIQDAGVEAGENPSGIPDADVTATMANDNVKNLLAEIPRLL